MNTKASGFLTAMVLALFCANDRAHGDADVYWSLFEGFSPSQVNISPGESVTWWNVDSFADVTISVTGFLPFTLGPFEGVYADFPDAGTYYMNSDWGDSGTIIVGVITPPPSVTITNPLNGAEIPANTPFIIQASASSTIGILSVEFWLEKSDYSWELIDTDFTEPYSATTNLVEGTYNVHALATATDYQMTSHTITFTVVPAPVTPIELENPRKSGNQFLFDVSGLLVGRTNIVQYCTDLSSGTWFPVATNTATSTTATVTNAWTPQTRLYRVRQLP